MATTGEIGASRRASDPLPDLDAPAQAAALRELVGRDAFGEFLGELAADTGATWIETLVKALALYRIAVDQVDEGNRIAITDRDLNVVQEITGLGTSPFDAEWASRAGGPGAAPPNASAAEPSLAAGRECLDR